MSSMRDFLEVGKRCTIAQVGGFRPEEVEYSSFGGGFYFKPEDQWPEDNDGYMIPIIQLYIPHLKTEGDLFGNAVLVQIFLNNSELPFGTPVDEGDRWAIRFYNGIDGLELRDTPEEVATLKSFPISWSTPDEPDYPVFEELDGLVDMDSIIASEGLDDDYFDDFYPQQGTKVGGYGAYIQSMASYDYDLAIQISTEQKAGFMVGHDGSIYILKSQNDGKWFLHWDSF